MKCSIFRASLFSVLFSTNFPKCLIFDCAFQIHLLFPCVFEFLKVRFPHCYIYNCLKNWENIFLVSKKSNLLLFHFVLLVSVLSSKQVFGFIGESRR